MIISIAGTPGSGKSTVAKILVEKLPAQRVYAGGIFRELARKQGITVEEILKKAVLDPEIDKEVDRETGREAKRLALENNYVIAEGRTQFHFIPESFKVFIKVDVQEGAKRIWKDLQDEAAKQERNEQEVSSFEETLAKVTTRLESDRLRYLAIYGFDTMDESKFDLVIDSTHISAEQVADKIIQAIKNN